MNLLFRLLLTLNTTSWMVVLYGVKQGWAICGVPAWGFGIVLLCVPVALSLASLALMPRLGRDAILCECSECSLADQEFLPVYLGYFFVALSVNDNVTMIFLYAILFVFTFVSQTQYFNPIFLLFGYHYYHVSTQKGTRVFLIAGGKVIRDKRDARFDALYRLNDTTYIARRG